MNTWVISDIHGCYYTLLRLLAKLPVGEPVVFAGDLIDRGPNSRQVVAHAMENNIPTVMGNHEHMCLFAYGHIKSQLYSERHIWMLNGGADALNSYAGVVPLKVLDWMRGLPQHIDLSPVCRVSHTGYGAPSPDSAPPLEGNLWIRDSVFPEDGVFRIFGHTQGKRVMVKPTWAKIDTGAAYSHQGLGTLSAFCWPTKQVIDQVYDENPL